MSEKWDTPQFEGQHKYAGTNVDKEANTKPPGLSWEFRDRLKEANLSPLEVGVLTLKYAYDETFESIGNEFSMLSTTVERIHNEAIEKLRGFKWQWTQTP